MRIGIGYDVHRLTEGRRLVLGGVDIPFDKGLLGWSDADVIVHAMIDSLLGAAALGDIGSHFPASDPAYKDISSIVLLRRTGDLIRTHGWRICNIDTAVIAERPLLGTYIGRMKTALSGGLSIMEDQIGVKVTTNEGIGFIGREEGIAAFSVALIEEA